MSTNFGIIQKTYTIVKARRNGGNQNQITLILIGGAVRDTMLEGNTKTYSINEKDYEVTLDFVDSNSAKFSVNGEGTKDMVEGETDKLSDGIIIGVIDILYQDYAGGVHSATFFLGAEKLEINDTNIRDSVSSHELSVNDETIDGLAVTIKGSDNNFTFKVDKIIVNISADDDYWVPAGGKLSENPEVDEPELIFTNNWDIEYRGLGNEPVNPINIKSSGSDDYDLEFVDGRGNKAKIPLIYAVSGSTIRLGDIDDDLIVQEGTIITKDDYFIITDENAENGERNSFALRYKGADKITADNPVIKFDDLGSGERIERTLNVFGGEIAQIKIGEVTFNVYNASAVNTNDFDIYVDLDADNVLTSHKVSINTLFGAEIKIGDIISNKMDIEIDTPNPEHYDNLKPSPLIFTLFGTNDEVRMVRHELNKHFFLIPENDSLNSYAYTSYGAFANIYSPLNDPQELTIWYPHKQRTPIVIITATDS